MLNYCADVNSATTLNAHVTVSGNGSQLSSVHAENTYPSIAVAVISVSPIVNTLLDEVIAVP